MITQQRVNEVLALIERVQATNDEIIKGPELACVLRLVFYAGVQKKEIPWLTIGQVWRNNTIADEVVVGEKPQRVRLPDEMKGHLENYLQWLQKEGGAPLDPDLALFPSYSGKSGVKQLTRHLKKITGAIGFNAIHKAGVKSFFDREKQSGKTDSQALEATAAHFRMTERSVEDLLADTIQPAGKKPEPRIFWLLCDMIYKAGFLDSDLIHASPDSEEEIIVPDDPKELIVLLEAMYKNLPITKRGVRELIAVFFKLVDDYQPHQPAGQKKWMKDDFMKALLKNNIVYAYRKKIVFVIKNPENPDIELNPEPKRRTSPYDPNIQLDSEPQKRTPRYDPILEKILTSKNFGKVDEENEQTSSDASEKIRELYFGSSMDEWLNSSTSDASEDEEEDLPGEEETHDEDMEGTVVSSTTDSNENKEGNGTLDEGLEQMLNFYTMDSHHNEKKETLTQDETVEEKKPFDEVLERVLDSPETDSSEHEEEEIPEKEEIYEEEEISEKEKTSDEALECLKHSPAFGKEVEEEDPPREEQFIEHRISPKDIKKRERKHPPQSSLKSEDQTGISEIEEEKEETTSQEKDNDNKS